uniref:Non-structural protein NS2 n=2 Tax=Bluetongue virus TaxID=40051 RepID=A0A7U3Q352_BTV|nr:non-structural protein-2 [Bluetongue virus 1]QPH37527.1 non-structural protein-2 [Bluetongue virus 4]QPH37582.1 non-structural protein-2 [Bluetongue virus 4]
MEQKQRKFTKNIFVLDVNAKTLCGVIAKQSSQPYCQIKIGRVIAFKPVKNPEPKGYVLNVPGPGAYRIQDGQDVISVMLTSCGVEATTERWEEWKFEGVSVTPMATRVQHNGVMVDAEIKYCKGMGIIQPYMKNDFDRNEMPDLPGVMRSNYDIRELRQKIKNEREMAPRPQVQSVVPREESRWMDEDEAKVSDEMREAAPSASRLERLREARANMFKEVEAGVSWNLSHQGEEAADGGEDGNHDDHRADEDEQGEDASDDEQPKTHITKEYIEKVAKQVKLKDERFMSLSSAMPQASGGFDRMIVTKKLKWQNVPLYCFDESTKRYELQCVGACERVAFVSKDMSLIILPVGV